jgi:diamine N-acetyltransferase
MTSPEVTLREITDDNRVAVLELAVSPTQTEYVASVQQSFDDAAAAPEGKPWYRAIYAGEHPVGFVMLSDGIAPADLVDGTLLGPYYLWRLLIDAKEQRRGYASVALRLVVDYLRGRPDAEVLLTSCVPGDETPIPFYEKQGFRATGVVHEGEHVLELTL